MRHERSVAESNTTRMTIDCEIVDGSGRDVVAETDRDRFGTSAADEYVASCSPLYAVEREIANRDWCDDQDLMHAGREAIESGLAVSQDYLTRVCVAVYAAQQRKLFAVNGECDGGCGDHQEMDVGGMTVCKRTLKQCPWRRFSEAFSEWVYTLGDEQ